MSSKLWELFLRDDVDSFRRVLATASYTSGSQRASGPSGSSNFKIGSPGGTIASTGLSLKSKKLSGTSPGSPVPDRSNTPRSGRPLSREELNARDQLGRTLLHLVASSTKPTATDFAVALLEVPFIDIYAQDWESGWTALHRALYAGNAAIAQALLTRDVRDATDFSKSGNINNASGTLIKIKDREGYSPFDVYGATIASRDIKSIVSLTANGLRLADLDNADTASIASSEPDDFDEDGHFAKRALKPRTNTTPRRVGASLFSAPIQSVSAIDQATAILLQNHEVWVFSQYGYSRLSFPLDISSSFIRNSFMSTRVLDSEPVINIKKAIMSESDVESYFRPLQTGRFPGTVWVMTTTSDIRIPVHEFILTGRSPVLRKAFHDLRHAQSFSIPDVLTINYDGEGYAQLQLQGVDFLTLLNLAFYSYTDNIFEVWQLAKHTPENASRYRQVRSEVMRVATSLGLTSLERSARLMIEPTMALKSDMERAINDITFFDSGDVIVELKNGTMRVHSQVICQRCPFFDALFRGRSGGRWLSSRRIDPTDDIYVDLKHIDRHVFEFVLRYMYADTEEQLFDQVRTNDLEEFIDLVLDVAFVANELMIDRLGQICQKMLGRFVTTRNVCHLLNATAPCCVTEFKDAALEYLEDLDEFLLGALDSVCHENQLSSFPVSRGRNSEEYVFEKYPELVSLVERDRRRKIDSMRLRSHVSQIETNEGKLRATLTPSAPSGQKAHQTPTKGVSAATSRSPSLRPQHSIGDLMFQMDDENLLTPGDYIKGKMAVRGVKPNDANDSRSYPDSPALGSSLTEGGSLEGRSYLDDQMASPQDAILAASPTELRASALNGKKNGSLTPPDVSQQPWSASVVSGSKKNLKDIMDEASETRVSNLSLGMSSAPRESNSNNSNNFTPKLSQKERKKIQQQQMQEMLAAQKKAKEPPQNPWKTATPTKPIPLGATDGQDNLTSGSVKSTPKAPSMTLRQTVAGTPPPSKPGTPPVQIQTRKASTTNTQTPSKPSISGPSTAPPPNPPATPQPQPRPAIQSVRHIPRPEPYQTSFTSPSPNSLSLATILMQQQTEKDEIREAATAKHNLQDIQAEQEFQEWWDKESRRIQGLPPVDHKENERDGPSGRSGRGKGGHGQGQQRKRRGGGGGGKGSGNTSTPAPSQQLHRGNGPDKPGQKKNSASTPRQQRPVHVDAAAGGNNARRSGRGGRRGRGKDRDGNI
ncbi:hypothetical protein APSETT445_001728 [Aspergillus pseudonomiae]